jgi:hypothetical protein
MATTPTSQTLGTLETSVRRLIQEEDTSNSSFTSSEIADYLNEGIRRLATSLEWQLAVFTASTVTDQTSYQLPAHVVSLIDVFIDSKPLSVLDRKDLISINQDWLTATSDEPRYAYRASRDTLGLYPKPSSTWNAKELRIQAVKLPDTLVDSSDAPNLHISFQDLLPYYAAFRCELKAGNNSRAADFLKLFQNGTKEIQAQLDRFSDAALGFQFGL